MESPDATTRQTLWEEFRAFFWGIIGLLSALLGFAHALLERASPANVTSRVKGSVNAGKEQKCDDDIEERKATLQDQRLVGKDLCRSELARNGTGGLCSEDKLGQWPTNGGELNQQPVSLPKVEPEIAQTTCEAVPLPGPLPDRVCEIGEAIGRPLPPVHVTCQHRTAEPEVRHRRPGSLSDLSDYLPSAGIPLSHQIEWPCNCKLGRRTRPKWWAVAMGRARTHGMFRTWAEANWLVDKVSRAIHQSFWLELESLEWMEQELS